MKYRRLTKEQLEEMHPEFINFLATQSITANEWDDIKKNKPQVAEEEIDVFSDLIWEGVLGKVHYIENISATEMHLFYLGNKEMKLIAIRIHQPGVDLTTKQGFAWFKSNFLKDGVEIMTANKAYSEDVNKDKFELIEKGGVITKGELYRYFDDIIDE
ncbi:DUF6495 family protein [Galbibacter pacificus]|uniref:DUF6495 family protein n=1 Tax=Galbibacter pacificus TaxID=2996052 RepID=A0ABT6FV03_9FLAO|nr:DUF6495 family protein [Galbibacter pacificus]MDG3583420.1 DUF6495 family protein [Galbibacter pacificus]MDG3587103.1 DUF6495 family protein [Galbibacter pacificus]